jgi:hypothetical protein
MVCESCRAAGALAPFIREPDLITTFLLGDVRITPEHLREDAVRLHGSCEGGTWCTCQHEVPEVPVAAAVPG